ncbi:MAG: asparagine synthase (glutamine-hydrolyzing) [Pirellula sp.]|jgi:asparagine synthase (glutamine-hydrolysing)|nr:asparagine synthase (glutamine-hydrolyzing) [Pirellula sp.]
MCGIAGGVWELGKPGLNSASLKLMTDALVHRGPDDSGEWICPAQPSSLVLDGSSSLGVALGFRRLSIIDLQLGHQPLGNEDGSVQIVFNGEIYNYKELRRRLEGAGHNFQTHSDTETIVHLYEDLGPNCFEHLNGMFAIALFDARKNRLVLARDRLGKKPLYYTVRDGKLYFASELKSLLQAPGLERRINPSAIDLYLTYQYIPHPESIYEGIQKLPPGHYAIFQNGELTVEPFWKIDWTRETPTTWPEASSRLRELLTDSIRLRLRSDVPVGAFLSGGIDSSLVVAIAQSILEKPIHTFSIGFSEADFDETQYAQQVADYVGTKHERFQVNPDAIDIIDKLAYQYDEPFSDSSAVPTWYLSELTKQNVTVALSGDGGDELFGGYERYRALILSQRMQRWLPTAWLAHSRLIKMLPDSSSQRSLFRRVRRFCEALGQSPPDRYMNWIQIFGEVMRASLYRDEFVERLPARDPADFLRGAWARSGKRDLLSCASNADLQTYLPCALMTKVDIASMAHSLEARQPFLDYRLVEWAASLPSSFKRRGSQGKYILKRTFFDMIPAEIWSRPKMGFGAPIGKWFKTTLRDRTYDALCSSDTRINVFFRPESVRRLVETHMRGEENQAYRLWNLLMLELWMRRWNPSI